VQDECGQAQRVIAVKMRDEDDSDVARVDTEPVHVRQQGRPAIQQHAAIDDDGPVVAVERIRRAAAEESELYATVTAGFR
jgi:hypothetical protein